VGRNPPNAPGESALFAASGTYTVTQNLGPLTLEGTLSPGISSIDTMAIGAAATTITYTPTSTLDIDLGSLTSLDRITSGSHTINGGTLQVSLVNGYTPAPFDAHVVIDGTAGSVVAGAFDSIVGPALTPPYVWKVSYTGQDVVVGVSCDADYNSDLGIDVLDLLDFLDFLNLFANGC
jgi:hypothetical protein